MKIRKSYIVTVILFSLFLMLTWMVLHVDVKPIGPEGSVIGLSTWNLYVFEKIGVYLIWYTITDWLGLIPILIAFGFAVLGFVQIIQRRSLIRVDKDILVLGFYFVLVISTYLFFEMFIINYRPIIIMESLEASFPSSHTMIVLCIMGASIEQFWKRIRHPYLRWSVCILSGVIIAVTIIGRLLSGVHWITDIIAGILLGAAFISLYISVVKEYNKLTIAKENRYGS